MYFIYTFFLFAGLLLAMPFYFLRSRSYVSTVKDRLGLLSIPEIRRSIWVHAVSVGEVNSVLRLIERLRSSYPGRPLVLSTMTPAGQQLARKSLGVVDHVFYFPFDLPGAIRRTLNHLNPEFVIIAETEIWPNFLRECRKRQIKVMMVNGRISDRSFPRYRLIRGWLKRVLDDYTVLGMQSETDRERIEMIGANSAKVTVFGNLKYDALVARRTIEPGLSDLLLEHQPLWIAASTTPGEEEHVLAAFKSLRKNHPALALLIAPRHPERFDAVDQLVRSSGFRCTRRTSLLEANGEVIILDSIGELASVFQYGTVVFMGGTLVPRGGHNILEPAAFSKPIVFGPYMENFREISDRFLEAGAAIQIKDTSELARVVDKLLTHPDKAAALGQNARSLLDRNIGATDRVMAFLQPAGV